MGKKDTIIIGYSGHAFVLADAIYSTGGSIAGYCDSSVKANNPFALKYLGVESQELLEDAQWIIGIGSNVVRERIYNSFLNVGRPIIVVHRTCTIGALVEIGAGSFFAANSVVNPLVTIGTGCIVNTGAIVEHECKVGDFAHIAPGAVLAGNVEIGNRSFIGANSVVKQGIKIGNDVTVGAGSVVISDIKDNETVVGNPSRNLSYLKK